MTCQQIHAVNLKMASESCASQVFITLFSFKHVYKRKIRIYTQREIKMKSATGAPQHLISVQIFQCIKSKHTEKKIK